MAKLLRNALIMSSILGSGFYLSVNSLFAHVPKSPNATITIGIDALEYLKGLKTNLSQELEVHQRNDKEQIALVELPQNKIPEVSHLIHEKFHRCGGFVQHDDISEGTKSLFETFNPSKEFYFVDYSITETTEVHRAIENLSESRIKQTIDQLSTFHNRFYQSTQGQEATVWLYNKWAEITKNRSDREIEFFQHPNFPQKSVILTIKGSEFPDDIIVIGGHADSIAGYWNRSNARAPGADDNASGISVITEVISILINQNYKPKRTIKFMAYAAEEVGLLGSKDIAESFKNSGKKVMGALQLDMTNFKSGTLDIVMMTDFTNQEQNAFLGKLIDEYVQVPWGYDKCGYGCSDHVSWHKNGYRASIPFETEFNSSNKKIHSADDTINVSGNNALHALKFAKLGTAFMIEMAK
jgi:leucyl aminopeptidase